VGIYINIFYFGNIYLIKSALIMLYFFGEFLGIAGTKK